MKLPSAVEIGRDLAQIEGLNVLVTALQKKLKRATRSASGKGADMIHLPEQDESQIRPQGNLTIQIFGGMLRRTNRG